MDFKDYSRSVLVPNESINHNGEDLLIKQLVKQIIQDMDIETVKEIFNIQVVNLDDLYGKTSITSGQTLIKGSLSQLSFENWLKKRTEYIDKEIDK
jgi:hypothetical protein